MIKFDSIFLPHSKQVFTTPPMLLLQMRQKKMEARCESRQKSQNDIRKRRLLRMPVCAPVCLLLIPPLSCQPFQSVSLPPSFFLVRLSPWWLKAALSALSVTISGCVWRECLRCVHLCECMCAA